MNNNKNTDNNELIDNFRIKEKEIRKLHKSLTINNKKNNFNTFLSDISAIDVDIDINNVIKLNDNDCIANIYRITNSPDGLYLIRNALDSDNQLKWAMKALEQYSSSSHNNLSNLDKISNNNANHYNSNIWFDSIKDNDNFARFKALRWSSLGYHYNWTDRQYQKDLLSQFPQDLANLCNNLSRLVDHDMLAEAAIVNYYPCGTSMSGHLDDAEQAMDEPIVSISLGCPAIFLIGDTTKDISPIPILIRSGDVIVMSGNSRYCYHGIAVVISHEFTINSTGFLQAIDYSTSECNYIIVVKEYLLNNRININARRVVQPSGEWINKQGTGAIKSSN